MKKNLGFILLLSMAALSLAGTAAYFSVFGLTKLFAAAGIGITILAASLEFAKLVTVSYVYRFWKSIKKGLRGFYVFAVIFIMLLTSVGIYGFLTGAYQQTAIKIESRDSQIAIIENKRNLFVNQLDRINKSIESSNTRMSTLSNLRTQQEQRLDNLYDKNNVSSAKRTETQITGSDQQINQMNKDISDLMKQTNSVNDSIAYYDQKIIELKSNDISSEIGPYKFIADITGSPINRIVNIIALLIICVFDPLAIALLIGINQLMLDNTQDIPKEKDVPKTPKNVKKKDDEDDVSVIEEPVTTTTTTTEEPVTTTTTTTEEPVTTTTTTTEESVTTTTTTEEPVTTTTTTTEEPVTTTTTTTEEFVVRGYWDVPEEVEEKDVVKDFWNISKNIENSEAILIKSDITNPENKSFFDDEEIESENEIESEPDSEPEEDVKNFLDFFDNDKNEEKNEYEITKIASTEGRINMAHFIYKND
ncbi:hypothetical protein M0Q97_04435 [Candidatus Dojkabacteria bacterium]|jgi:hypothetical protein|nr:hypothetical protein [Candidatus Dojkabacteria bacterium]